MDRRQRRRPDLATLERMRRAFLPPGLLAGPFTRQQALAAGLSDTALQSAPWRQAFRGVYVHVDVVDDRQMRLDAVKLVLPQHAVLCGLTAAWVYGADVRRSDDLDVHVSCPKGLRMRRRPGVVPSQETLRPDDIWHIGDIAVTSPTRTVFDCMRLLRGDERLVVADALTHLGRTTVEEVRAYFAGQRRMRNLRIAEALLDDIEPKSESPMETRVRCRLIANGLPRPEAQWEVRRGELVVARLDLAYPAVRLGVEYDGTEWHQERRAEDEARRFVVRHEHGWEVLVFFASDVFQRPEAMANRVRAELRRRTALSAA